MTSVISMRASDLQDLLAKVGARPIKARGQHFLLDDAVVAKVVAAAGIAPGDTVLEIGPGPGILTAALLDAGASVIAVELDVKMVHLLEERFAGRDLRVIHGDILRTDLSALGLAHDATYAVVANIPYNITTPIIEMFLGATPSPRSMTLMVQKEVADRILAKRGDMNALAVFVRTSAHVTRVTNVARGAFLPPPKVESSVIHIVHKSAKEMSDFFDGADPSMYAKIVRAAFQGKRKQLRNSLRAVVAEDKELEKYFNAAKISPSERPEQLDLDDWQRLARAVAKTP